MGGGRGCACAGAPLAAGCVGHGLVHRHGLARCTHAAPAHLPCLALPCTCPALQVVQTPGFQCSIQATAAFRMPAKTLYKQASACMLLVAGLGTRPAHIRACCFGTPRTRPHPPAPARTHPPPARQVITHPDNAAIFRHMKRCAYRRVLSDDGHGRRRVKVAHEATWRFLLLHGTFTTKRAGSSLLAGLASAGCACGGAAVARARRGRVQLSRTRHHPRPTWQAGGGGGRLCSGDDLRPGPRQQRG